MVSVGISAFSKAFVILVFNWTVYPRDFKDMLF